MRWRHTKARPIGPGQAWGRRKVLLALAGAVVVGIVLLVGLGLTVHSMLTTRPDPVGQSAPQPIENTTRPDSPVSGPRGDAERAQGHQVRDRLAAEPMFPTTPEDFRPQEPSTTPAQPIQIPPATTTGPVGVPTGFPRTPQGAVGQLAAITTTVLTGMDIRQANQVYQAWSQPGASGGPEWVLTGNVQAFLAATTSADHAPATTTVVVTPRAGMVKALDGPDWAVACVLMHVRAVVITEAQIAYGHCERMIWQGHRWVIEDGERAARAPSTWPGTERARLAGWREWSLAPHRQDQP